MGRCIQKLLEAREFLAGRGNADCGPDDFRIIEALSGPERLAYRAGCIMARSIEEEFGRKTVIDLIEAGPREFFRQYLMIGNAGGSVAGF